MSESGGGDGGPGRREVAYRLFAAEYDDADLSYSESDEERAPNYVVTPSGARVNRLFVVGVLTEVESVSEDYLRARVVDPTGPFVIYAGQYQPEAMRFLESADPPTFVAVTGKARTFQPEDSDRVYTSVRPESINEVDAGTRDRWVIQAAEGTVDRVARMAEAKASGLEGDDLEASLAAHGVGEGLSNGIPIALDHYGTTGEYLETLRETALDALRVVASEQDEVEAELPTPDQGSDDALAALVEETVEPVAAEADGEPADQELMEAEPESADTSETSAESETTAEPEPTEPEAASETGESADAQVATAEAGTETETGGEASPEEPSDASGDELGDFEGDFDLDDEEREEIESEYGTEFKSGTEVEEPGEADIDMPQPEEATEADGESADQDVEATDVEDGEADEPTGETGQEEPMDEDTGEDTADAADVALDDAVMDAMVDLDDGDGADRDAVIGEVVDATGADPGDVEEAIQDALMDGLCYEPDDGTLKPI